MVKTIERALINGDFLRIHLEIRDGHDMLSDGFAITADLYEKRGNRTGRSRYNAGRDMDAGGCMHDEILKAVPSLAPFVAVHLADLDGTPMHAVANGWYFYSGDARRYEENRGDTYSNREGLTDHQRGARSLNIAAGDLPVGMDKAQFVAFADSLRPVWAAQVAAARAVFDAI